MEHNNQAYVVPVMDYCSGIWGYGDNDNLVSTRGQ